MRWLLQTQSFRCDQIWCLIYNKRQKTIAVLRQLFAKNILVSFRQLLTSFYDYWISYSQSYFGITNVIYKYEALSSECSHVLVQMSCMHLICTQVAMCASLKIKITLICSSQSMPSIFCWFLQIALFPSSATSVNQLVTQFWKPSFQVLNVAELLRILKICFYHHDDGNVLFILMTMKIFWPDFENPQRPRWSSTPLLAKPLCWIHLHKINIRFSTNRKKTSSTRKTVSKWNLCCQWYICIQWKPWRGNANILSTHPKVFSFCPQSTGSHFHSWNWNWNISYWHNIE